MEHDGKLWKTMGQMMFSIPFFPLEDNDPSSGLSSPGCQGRTTGLPHALRVSAPGCHGKSSPNGPRIPNISGYPLLN